MGIDKAIVTVILVFIGLVIMIAIIFYYYKIIVKRADSFNTTKKINEILSIVPLSFVFSKNKKANNLSFFIFLILALLVIVAMIFLYYLIYRGVISFDIENETNKAINNIK